jgi:dTDP-4-amino-4,6-dideoxygalactose transaminase
MSTTASQVHNIPLLDLKAQHQTIREEIFAEVTRVIDSQKFILGEDVLKLEKQIAEYCGVPHAIGCASGSDALFLALLALELKPGDKVLTTPYTFFATVGAIVRAGLTPAFVDTEPDTFNMDMAQAKAALQRDPAIRAVIPIHLFGATADMSPLMEIAAEKGVAVIEDAAQAIGAEYRGRRAGSIGNIACFSFFPSKNLGAYGDGGMLTTTDASLGERLRALRVHGTKRKYYHDWVGVNSRLDALQAAILSVKFRHLDSWTDGRQRNAEIYRRRLGAADLPLRLPVQKDYQTRHVYNQFCIQAQRRDELQTFLKQRGIGTEVYYPLPLHLQVCFQHLGGKPGDYPECERQATEALALPIYAELRDDDIHDICDCIEAFYRS